MVVSVALAASGIALAHLFYVRRPELPAQFATRFATLYKLLYDKYRIDELYDATVVRGTRALSRGLALFDERVVDGIVNGVGSATRLVAAIGGGIDRYIIDGAVNGVAWSVRSVGSQARKLQSGVIQNYVLVVFVGVAAIVVLMRLL
jgi:NADH-quinone oxidoreductase subunit L